jgi:acetoin utilization protein AcuB
MLISDVMNTNVVSIPSTTTLAEARRIMDAHNIRRLPVIDRSLLVGIINKESLDKMGPSKLTTFSVNELVYLLNKITVKDVMRRDVVTVSPDTTIEEAVAIAQAKKIGALVVVEGDTVMGIATTNDIFLGILNPLLGIGKKGSRICVINCFSGPDIEKVISIINKHQIGISNLFVTEFPNTQKHDLIVHLDDPEGANIISPDIRKLGFMVVQRKR